MSDYLKPPEQATAPIRLSNAELGLQRLAELFVRCAKDGDSRSSLHQTWLMLSAAVDELLEARRLHHEAIEAIGKPNVPPKEATP